MAGNAGLMRWQKTGITIQSSSHIITVYVKSEGTISSKKYKRARWDHTYRRKYLVSKKTGKEYFTGTSNYYMFSAFGDRFNVENSISHRKFDAEKIKAACTLCGINKE